MRYDAGVVRCLDDVHTRDQDGELEHPVDRVHAFRRDDQLRIEEPQAERLGNYNNNQRHQQVKRHAHVKDALQSRQVPASQFHAHKALGGSVQGGLQEGEQGDDPAYDPVQCEIVHAQHVQYDPRGVQRYGQPYQHTHVKRNGIFGDQSFVFKFRHFVQRHLSFRHLIPVSYRHPGFAYSFKSLSQCPGNQTLSR